MQIKRFTAEPQQIPSAGGVVIPYRGNNMSRSAGGGLADIGKSLMSVAKDMQDVDDHFKRARQASMMSNLRVGLARASSDIELEYDDRQDYENFNKDIDTKLDKMRQEYIDQIGDDNELLNAFMPEFDIQAIQTQSNIRRLSRAKFVDADRAALNTELDNVYELAGRSAGDYNNVAGKIRGLGLSAIAGRVASGVLDPDQGQILKNQFESQYWNNYLHYQALNNPIETEQALMDDKLFPGLDRNERLSWQDKVSDLAENRRISNYVNNAIAIRGNDFAGMFYDLDKANIPRDRKSKIMDNIESLHKDYTNNIEKFRSSGRRHELEQINMMSADEETPIHKILKYINDSEYLTDSEKEIKLNAFENLRNGDTWRTDPKVELELTRRIDSGTLTDPADIDIQIGSGIDNITSEKLKNRLKNKGSDAVKENILSGMMEYAKSKWVGEHPVSEDANTHDMYMRFQNQIRDELEQKLYEAKESGRPFTRNDAINHIDDYFKGVKVDVPWWPFDRTEYQHEKLVETWENPETGVPELESKKISEYLKSRDMSVSPENIKEFYDLNKDKPAFSKLMGNEIQSQEANKQMSTAAKQPKPKPIVDISKGIENIKTKDGLPASEITTTVEIDGESKEIPLMVPTLTQNEIQSLLNGEEPTEQIINKAIKYAKSVQK